MNVMELNREQIRELKGNYLDNLLYEEERRSASYGELADADYIVSDFELFKAYSGIDFVNEDFFCSMFEEV